MEMEVTLTFMSSSKLNFFNLLTVSESAGACAMAQHENTVRQIAASARNRKFKDLDNGLLFIMVAVNDS
jgi:hypothetical protein